MSEKYIDILLQSLRKKEQVLNEIIRLDDVQKAQLENEMCSVEDFDQTVEAKSKCIEQLEQLDSGFQKLYAEVETEIKDNREKYSAEIKKMQECIRSVTDKSVKIQAQEARNKELLKEKIANVHKQATEVRKNSRAITGYYNSMKEW